MTTSTDTLGWDGPDPDKVSKKGWRDPRGLVPLEPLLWSLHPTAKPYTPDPFATWEAMHTGESAHELAGVRRAFVAGYNGVRLANVLNTTQGSGLIQDMSQGATQEATALKEGRTVHGINATPKAVAEEYMKEFS